MNDPNEYLTPVEETIRDIRAAIERLREIAAKAKPAQALSAIEDSNEDEQQRIDDHWDSEIQRRKEEKYEEDDIDQPPPELYVGGGR